MSHGGLSPDAALPLDGCRILVVEDEWLIADDVAQTLEAAGAIVVGPYPTVVEALEHLCDVDAIDGAVIDIGLGEEQSYPLADAFLTTAMPFLFLTGVQRSQLPDRFARVPHMLKPFDPKAIVRALLKAGVASH